MPQPRVSIRLGTDGKAQVERDFADLGDAGDASAKRIGMAYDRAANEADAALAKLQKAGARLAAVAPSASGPSNLINPITGGSYAQADGAAQASARAIQQQMAAGEQAAQRLLASLDPLYAAQLRYDTALAEANALQRQGSLTSAQLATVQTGLKAELDQATALYGKQGAAIGNTRVAQMELMHVVRGSVDQFAAGAPPMQIFTMHLGMLGQAAALSGDSLGKFGAFMASGWGLALTVAVVALGPLVAKLFDTGNEVDGLVEKLKKEAAQQALNDQAHQAFAKTLEGVAVTVRDLEKAMAEYEHRLETTSQKELDKAKSALATAIAARAETEANISLAQSLYEVQKARASGPGQRGELATLGLPQAEAKLDALQNRILDADKDIAKAQQSIDFFQSAVTAEAAQADGVEQIKARYAALIEAARRRNDLEAIAARKAGDTARAQALVTTELDKQVRLLKAKGDAEVKAYEDAHRTPGANAGGTAIFDSQIAAFFDIANRHRGQSETGDRSTLRAFLGNVDPEKTKWCAAFVNAVLAAGGVHGSGSLAASSFLNFGKDDTHSPQKGDIVVLRSGAGEHVGFLDSIDAKGNVRVLAGNTGNRVGEATYTKSQVLAIRRPPTPGEQATLDDKATDAAVQAQSLFDNQRAQLNEQLLRELGKVAIGYEAQATVQLRIAQAEHDAEATKIAGSLAEGKYGEATGQLAKTRAAELTSANDALLLERQAAIALGEHVKFLQGLDAADERETRYRLDDLEYAASIARSSSERRELERQIVAIQYDEKKKHLEYLLALAQLTGNTKDAADITAQLAHLPEERARAGAQADRQNMSPWQEYLSSLPQTIGEIDDAFGKAAADGMRDFNQGLVDAALHGKSLGDVLHNVFDRLMSDLLEVSLQMAESELFGGGQHGQSGSGGTGGLFAGILSAVGSMFGGSDPSGGGSVGHTHGFAGGTEYAPGGFAWVGEHGKEMVRLPRGSKVYNAAESRRIAAANDRAPGLSLTFHNDFRGADASAVDGISARLDRFERELPRKVVGIFSDARERFVIREQG